MAHVERVLVIAPDGSKIPEKGASTKLTIIPSWQPGSVRGLIHAAASLLRCSREVDLFIFDIYPPLFGRRNILRFGGMLLPVLLRILSGKPVATYLHHLVGSLDLAQLGYAPSAIQLTAASLVEAIIAFGTTTFLPLMSQVTRANPVLRPKLNVLFLPFVEGVLVARMLEGYGWNKVVGSCPLRLLLLGAWGPQKDLKSALIAVRTLVSEGVNIRLTIAGHVNTNLIRESADMSGLTAEFESSSVDFIFDPSEEKVACLLATSAGVILPYNTTGGPSGVLSMCALLGLPVIAYDVPPLREAARLLGADVTFVPKRDVKAIEAAIITLLRDSALTKIVRPHLSSRIKAAKGAVRDLLEHALNS
ncbi:MAG: glycosyltransferase [Nitrososphaerota archaeon]|nr:glycosyltransferase [Nitrososphaerota archaeon]